MKLAIAQIATEPGDIEGNTKKIIKYINIAKKNKTTIVVFPELSIPGYMSLDLMIHSKYIDDNLKALREIIKFTKNIFVIVGFIDCDKNKIGPDNTPIRYNSAAIIYNQKLLAIQDKTLLPDYDVFFENRYFSQGRGRKVIDFQGIRLGVQICEDLWDDNYPLKVSEDLIDRGAKILINISGSPFYVDKIFDREKLVRRTSLNHKVPFIYANTVGVQDGYDGQLVFDGQSMVFDNFGKLIALGKQFEEDLIYVNSNKLFHKDNAEIKLTSDNKIVGIYKALIFSIKSYFEKAGFVKAFIGISGGIDSAVVATIVVKALGVKNVTGIFMPSSFSSSSSLEDSKALTKNLGIKLEIIPINDIYDTFLNSLKKQFSDLPFNSTEENIQARIRGMILMAHANKFNGLVISTANKTETALGYSTLYGDMCGAIAPLSDISKLRVYRLAEFINSLGKKIIPENIIKKIPSAELRDNQSDEQSLGASYSIISPLVDEIVEEMKTKRELINKYPEGVVRRILDLINRNEYKRRQAAPGVKVTKKAFGIGRRIPIAHKFSA